MVRPISSTHSLILLTAQNQPGPPFTIDPAKRSIYNSNHDHLLVTASFGRILPDTILELFPPNQRLNVHPSILPAYRGAAPIQHAIMNGERKTGVCVIQMLEKAKGIDAGRIWASQHTVSFSFSMKLRLIYLCYCYLGKPIPEDERFGPLRDGLARQGGRLLVSVLRDMLAGKVS